MAYTTADRDALKKAIATGVRSVTFADGRNTTYRSLDEMRQILGDIERELGLAASARRPARRVRVIADKGL